jgi:hypothetical protein
MYELQEHKAAQGVIGLNSRRVDITIGENLDERIMRAERNLQELKDTKARIEATGLLTARIDDLRRAMDY